MTVHDQIAEAARTKGAIYIRMAKRLVPDGIDPEDAVQDAYLLALQKAKQFRGDSQLSTWLGTIVINCARLKARRHRPMDELVDELPFYTRILTDLDEQKVRQAVTRLNEPHRGAIEAFLAEMTHAETAALFCIPIGTSKARLRRAKNLLRKKMLRTAA